jgi:hypothetical protein
MYTPTASRTAASFGLRRIAVMEGHGARMGARMPERVQCGVDDAGRLHALVRYDQRTPDADPFALLPEQADGAELELDWPWQ